MNYEQALGLVFAEGVGKDDRTGTGTYSVPGVQITYDMRAQVIGSKLVVEEFPAITSKEIHMKSVIGELLWFISGDTNNNTLKEKYGVTIWDEWAPEDGELGPIYGNQWRTWGNRGIDQLQNLIDGIKSDPFGRRHIVTAWNPEDIDKMALPPCHLMYQVIVDSKGKMHMIVTQRSADMFLGVPFNLASYGLLLSMVAGLTGYLPGRLVWNGGDCHVYKNHTSQVITQLDRDKVQLPTLELDFGGVEKIDDFTNCHIRLFGYSPHAKIKAPVAV